jgi:CRP-like cAMP-binding protein
MGEMSFLLNNRRSAAVKAETDGSLVKISKRSFISVIKKYPHYGIYLAKVLAQKLIRSNEQASPDAVPGPGRGIL